MAAPSTPPEKTPAATPAVQKYIPSWRERIDELRVYTGPIFAGLLVLGVAGWYVFGHLLPGRADAKRRGAEAHTATAAQASLQQTIDAWEDRYRNSGDVLEDAALHAEVDRLIERQAALLKSDRTAPKNYPQLSRLEKLRDSLKSRQAAARSAIAERQATDARQGGDAALASQRLREALELQKTANARATSDAERNGAREAQLRTLIDDVEVASLQPLVAAAQSRVAEARAGRNNADLVQALREERAARVQLNQRGPASRYADAVAVKRLDEEIDSVQAAELASLILTREQRANEAAGAGHMEDAAAGFAAAAELQRRLNTTFPQSRTASIARLDELENRRQDMLASGLIAKVVALDRDVTQLLRRSRADGVGERASATTALLTEIAASYPRSRLPDATLRSRAIYRWLKRDEIADVISKVNERLVELPTSAGLRIFSCEVAQELYQRVMNANPSRDFAPPLPVESVTWHEAREFCQRLSWILGRPVRLPTERDLAALLRPRGAIAWSAETANGHTHPVGSSTPGLLGLHDLHGNVAEWLHSPEESGPIAPIAGGSFLDAQAAIERTPVTTFPKHQRARHIGFRFVVEE